MLIKMIKQQYFIRNAKTEEFGPIGRLMTEVYSGLEGFPGKTEQPDYYNMLVNIGELTKRPGAELLAAISPGGKITGAVVYFSDMKYYGSGGTATREENASGFRLLAVDPGSRGGGIGSLLIAECIRRAILHGHSRIIIHTTLAMQTAWKMYEKLGFVRSADLDFMQGGLPVYGFSLKISSDGSLP
jgi:GNAT superfamily N-acetyltransferase